MTSKLLIKPKYEFLTESGEIRFREDKRYFIFYNPHTPKRPEDGKDRCETIVLMNTLRQLVNYLPDAKRVAKEFNDMVASGECAEGLKLMDGEIYSQVLSNFEGKDSLPSIKHMLLVSTYNGKSYIWLKRFFQDMADEGGFKACRGGYLFGQGDDENGIKVFADRCMDYVNEVKKRTKMEMEMAIGSQIL
jgi:hypothetical protein